MNTLDTIREFIGWCTIINSGILLLASISLMLLQGPVIRIHSKILHIDAKTLPQAYFQFLAQYKIAIIVLNFVPYIALKIMS